MPLLPAFSYRFCRVMTASVKLVKANLTLGAFVSFLVLALGAVAWSAILLPAHVLRERQTFEGLEILIVAVFLCLSIMFLGRCVTFETVASLDPLDALAAIRRSLGKPSRWFRKSVLWQKVAEDKRPATRRRLDEAIEGSLFLILVLWVGVFVLSVFYNPNTKFVENSDKPICSDCGGPDVDPPIAKIPLPRPDPRRGQP